MKVARSYNIRWTDKDKKDLQRAVKTFNQKIDRMAKRNPEIKNALPEKIKMKEIKSLIQTRQDFKREINSLRRFSKKGNDEIVSFGYYDTKVTKWQKNEISLRLKVINRERKKKLQELQELEMTQGGKPLGYKKGQIGMGKIEQIELLPMKGLTPGMNSRDVKEKWRSILYQSQTNYLYHKDERLKNNYIKGLTDNFSENEVNEIIEKIKKMKIKDFLEIYYTDESIKLDSVYTPDKEEHDKKVEELKTAWL